MNLFFEFMFGQFAKQLQGEIVAYKEGTGLNPGKNRGISFFF